MPSETRKSQINAPDAVLLQRLGDIIGEPHVITDPDAQKSYLTEWRDRYQGRAAAVLRPKSADEVSQILWLANDARVAIVPQGGNTGLVGGQIPFESGREIVLSLSRLNAIRSIDPTRTHIVAEAGATLASVQAAASDAGRLFPLSIASEGSAQIGGILATNAGGIHVVGYGSARHLCLGLEAVFADGRIWHGLTALKKDNTGYDLRDLLIGSEGTLAVITAATLKLVPAPAEKATALATLGTLDDVLALFRAVEAAGPALTAFEFLSGGLLDIVLRHTSGTRAPFASTPPWTVLIELSGSTADGTAVRTLETLLEANTKQSTVGNCLIAGSLSQAADFWRLRETASEAQKFEGGSIKHDISVPVAAIPEFIARAAPIVESICPGARPVPFGHFGDGNVHYNVSQPPGMEKAGFLALWDQMTGAIHALVTEMGGSIAAEHGIGRMKRDALAQLKSEAELDVMRRIKAALDPNGILNPGKVL